jgi:DNA topoisomerase VI subunit B
VQNQLDRANLFERYMPEVADALSRLTGQNKELILTKLKDMTDKEEIKQQIYEMETLKGEADEKSDDKPDKESDDTEEPMDEG